MPVQKALGQYSVSFVLPGTTNLINLLTKQIMVATYLTTVLLI